MKGLTELRTANQALLSTLTFWEESNATCLNGCTGGIGVALVR
jgi:hypothetical protein